MDKLCNPLYAEVYSSPLQAKVFVSEYADKQDFKDNLITAKIIADTLGIHIKIRPHVDSILLKGYTNPEYEIDGLFGDRKTIASHNSVREMIDKAKQQMFNKHINPCGKDYIIIIDISNNSSLNIDGLKHELSRKITKDRGSHIHSIIFVNGKKAEQLMRDEIVRRNFDKLYKIK